MKKNTLYILLLLAPIALWAQVERVAPVDINLSDVIVVEGIPTTDNATGVVEIPETPIEGASINLEAPMIPEVTESLPTDTEIVLEIPGQGAAAPGEASMASGETISVDFPDEDVRTILRNVAELFELNLVIPDTLQGRTSIKLRNITWNQVFEVVLQPLGFTFVEDRNIVRVLSIEELTSEPVDTRVFVANYARAEDLKNSIAPLIDSAAGGLIEVDVRSNALVITERPSRMNKIQEVIDRLDRATDQVMIESKFIEVSNTDAKNLGVNWASLSGYSASAGPFQRDIENTETDSRTSSSSTGSTVPINQASIDAATIAGSTLPLPIFDNPSVSTNIFSDVKSTIDTAVFSADQFEVILSALNTQDDIKLVSNPTVVTLNNSLAKIAIGESYPIPEYTFNAETGQRQLDKINYKDIGINLEVTPQVNSAGFINLKIIPEVSSTERFALIENTEIPIIDSRRTETTIMIKDGYTLAIGGLVEDKTTNRETKVPFLGDLPGLGRLFRSNSDTIEQRNLIIFITAKTLNPDGSTYRDIIDPRVIDRMGIVPSELPGYNLSAEEKDLLDRLEAYRIEASQKTILEDARQKIEAIEARKQQEAAEAEQAEQGEQREQAEQAGNRSNKRY
jgi:type IV pilus assembly protein PilQ